MPAPAPGPAQGNSASRWRALRNGGGRVSRYSPPAFRTRSAVWPKASRWRSRSLPGLAGGSGSGGARENGNGRSSCGAPLLGSRRLNTRRWGKCHRADRRRARRRRRQQTTGRYPGSRFTVDGEAAVTVQQKCPGNRCATPLRRYTRSASPTCAPSLCPAEVPEPPRQPEMPRQGLTAICGPRSGTSADRRIQDPRPKYSASFSSRRPYSG